MVAIRRWYIFLVCLISLQAVAWATITLTQNLLLGDTTPASTAFQIAVTLIGLPMYLGHWLWAQRLAAREADERDSALRHLYLYGTLVVCLIPMLGNTYEFVANLLARLMGQERNFGELTQNALLENLVVVVVLGALWAYHWHIITTTTALTPETGNAATVRRWYVLIFSAAGLMMSMGGAAEILRWIMLQFSLSAAIGGANSVLVQLTDSVALVVVGTPLWVIAWHWAQQLFAAPNSEERESALRKFYLYASVFIATLITVTNATFLLAGLFRRLLGLEPQGALRDVLPQMLGAALVWAYQTYALRQDATLAQEAPRQAAIRRLYWYLVAAVGLGAFLVGVAGDVTVLIRALTEPAFGDELRERLAWCTAALIAGLPVWLWPWRSAQTGAVAAGPEGGNERRSIVRKIYLYFYLFLATMTVLSSLVYIVYRILSLVLGATDTGDLPGDLAQALAFALIAAAVWAYHGLTLRGDGTLNQQEQTQQLAALRVAVVDAEDGQLAETILAGLRRELPDLTLLPIGLTLTAAQRLKTDPAQSISAQLADVGLIIGAWNLTFANGNITAEVAATIAASPARKLLLPTRLPGWEWAGVDRWSAEGLTAQAVQAVKQVIAGEEVKPVRPLSAGSIIAIAVGVLLLALLFIIPIIAFFAD